MWVHRNSEAKPGVQLTLNEPPTPVPAWRDTASPSTVSALRMSLA